MSSPSQQVGERQPGMTKLLVEPHTEVVQRYSRRQARSQTPQLVGSLPPQAEGVEELIVDALDDLTYLTYSGHPSPEPLGPVPLAAVVLGRWMMRVPYHSRQCLWFS